MSRRWPVLVVMLLVLYWRRLRAISFRVLIAVIVLITCRRIGRLKQLVERRCRSSWLRYTLARHVVSLLWKHCTRWSRHTHHRLGISLPELNKTVGFSVTVDVMLLFRRWWMVTETVSEATRRRWRIAVLVRWCLFKIVSLRHVTITSRRFAMLRSAVLRSSAVTATHTVVAVMIDRHLLLLFAFRRVGCQAATHGRPALLLLLLVAAILEAGHVQRPVLVAVVHVAARLVFRVRSSHVMR